MSSYDIPTSVGESVLPKEDQDARNNYEAQQTAESMANSVLANEGGRRHRGSKKMHKGKRHGNASLRAWVTFVKKVQREEKLSYKEAMMRAKQRKDKGEKWHGGERWRGGDEEEDKEVFVDGVLMGGRRHRRTHKRSRSHSRSRAHKRSRSHRRSRRHH